MKLIQVIKISIVLLIFWLSSKALAQNLNITSFQPSSQSMTSVDNLVITVSFDSAIDPASVDNLSFTVFGRWSGACPGTFSFRNNNQQIHFAPDKIFRSESGLLLHCQRIFKDHQERIYQPVSAGISGHRLKGVLSISNELLC